MTKLHHYVGACSIALCTLLSTDVVAEVELVNKDHIFNDHDNFKLTSHGSLRLQALNFDHYDASNEGQKYRRNGYSAGSRIYLDADYKINDDLNLISGYQNFINPAKILGWDGHYVEQDEKIRTEQLYFGLSSKQYGTLKFGKQYSVYYDVVGSKTNLWDYDTIGQAQTWSPFAYVDGTQAARKMLRYEKKNKYADLYAAYLFEDESLPYKRKSGEELAIDVHLNKELSWATSWKHNRASLQYDDEQHDFSQQVLATALFYFDGKWLAGAGAGWYKNTLPNYSAFDLPTAQQAKQYLNSKAYGVEYYLGYNFQIAHHGLQSIRPYVMGNYLKYTQGDDFYRQDNGVGVAVRFDHGIGFDYERLYTSDTMNTPDMHMFRLRYDW